MMDFSLFLNFDGSHDSLILDIYNTLHLFRKKPFLSDDRSSQMNFICKFAVSYILHSANIDSSFGRLSLDIQTEFYGTTNLDCFILEEDGIYLRKV